MAAKKEETAKSPSKKMLITKNAGKTADPPAQEPAAEETAKVATKNVITKAKTKAKETPTAPPAEAIKSEAAEVTEDLIVQAAKEVENATEAKAFAMVSKLQNNIEHDFFKLGGYLSIIQQNNWQMEKNYETFRAWVEAETGLKYRKAMYLIAIYDGLLESGVKWEQVAHLGWTKLKELASILTPENVGEWVALAESMTVIQLQEHIKASTAGIGSDGESGKPGEGAEESKKITTKTFKLHEDQKETVDAALEKAKHEGSTEFEGKALEYICLEFLSGSSKLKKVPTLKELMQKASAEEVLNTFGEVFPKIEITAQIPEEA